eukprot:7765109-Alexandrium_andersonii.AAC.1
MSPGAFRHSLRRSRANAQAQFQYKEACASDPGNGKWCRVMCKYNVATIYVAAGRQRFFLA